MRKTGIKKAKTYDANFALKGPYGIFMSKLKHPKIPEVDEILMNVKEETKDRFFNYKRISLLKDWAHFKNKNVENFAHARMAEFENDKKIISVAKTEANDSILGYYLFRNAPDEMKDRISDIFESRYMINVPDKFSHRIINQKREITVRKTAFVMWMNHYLENCVSEEFLELSSFEIALKLGMIWSSLPMREQVAWRKLAAEDERHDYDRVVKKYLKRKYNEDY